MSSHVGSVVVGGFLPEKEAEIEELGGKHSSSIVDPKFLFEQGNPRCMSILLTRVIYHFMLATVSCIYV
jgi:hypothetical protein